MISDFVFHQLCFKLLRNNNCKSAINDWRLTSLLAQIFAASLHTPIGLKRVPVFLHLPVPIISFQLKKNQCEI